MIEQERRRGEVTIVGGGLVGSLLAIFLARRGFPVTLYERRPDPRATGQSAGRSINLVITSRGTEALRRLGLATAASRLTVPVLGRMMHAVDGALAYQPYGRDESEHNRSISRAELNRFLLVEAEREGVGLHFGRGLVSADLERGRLRLAGDDGSRQIEVEAGVLAGVDGAGSVLRGALAARPGYRVSIDMLEQGYKELLIPAGPGGQFRIEPGVLHIWPRGRFMLMALPNPDGSFTITLYLPHEGPASFGTLDSDARVTEFFEAQFPDAVPLIPDLTRDFFANPTGSLGTVRCDPWHLGGRAVLVGDAAHAIVPFFGQGMNCGFEDCTVLDDLIERHGADWETIFAEFTRARKPNTDAIAEMALENFVEMRDRVGDAAFLLCKQVEHRLESAMPLAYRSRYSMVSYSTIPYAVALAAGRIQEGILDELCAGLRSAEELDLGRARELIGARLTPFLESRGVSLDY